MNTVYFEEIIDKIVEKDSRYTREAYFFLREALDHTQKVFVKKGEVRHVSGRELLDGVRGFALEQYGPMTLMVLDAWGIRTTADIGEIVFNMVDSNVLAKTDEDTREAFKDIYDFVEVFKKPFQPSRKVVEEPKSTV
jgi:uncharacterized repeat protein (TIGR04138 family)